jgi:protein-L-isoaspartate(D-aspartate) O-methyltransferase
MFAPYNKPEVAAEEPKLAAARREMVDKQLRLRGICDGGVLKAFLEVPRERFIDPDRRHEAYIDSPVPIGCGQTISQPYIVALMLQELALRPEHRVLDVGAGSGYQTALLARLVREVYAIERIEELTEEAAGALAGLGIENVTLRTGDGTLGWPEQAPFDRIVCGAGAPDVPPAWIEQLADDGRIILPVGGLNAQVLELIEKHGQSIRRREVCDVRFVKLIGCQGWPE